MVVPVKNTYEEILRLLTLGAAAYRDGNAIEELWADGAQVWPDPGITQADYENDLLAGKGFRISPNFLRELLSGVEGTPLGEGTAAEIVTGTDETIKAYSAKTLHDAMSDLDDTGLYTTQGGPRADRYDRGVAANPEEGFVWLTLRFDNPGVRPAGEYVYVDASPTADPDEFISGWNDAQQYTINSTTGVVTQAADGRWRRCDQVGLFPHLSLFSNIGRVGTAQTRTLRFGGRLDAWGPADWNAVSGAARILNKPEPGVAADVTNQTTAERTWAGSILRAAIDARVTAGGLSAGTLAEITGATGHARSWTGSVLRAGIRAQAPVADWNVTSTTSLARIANKPAAGTVSEIAGATAHNRVWSGSVLRSGIRAQAPPPDWNVTSGTSLARIINKPGTGTLAEITGATNRIRVWTGAILRSAIDARAPVADWNQSSTGTSRARILNKPTIPTLPSLGSSSDITAGRAGSKLWAGSTLRLGIRALIPAIPTVPSSGTVSEITGATNRARVWTGSVLRAGIRAQLPTITTYSSGTTSEITGATNRARVWTGAVLRAGIRAQLPTVATYTSGAVSAITGGTTATSHVWTGGALRDGIRNQAPIADWNAAATSRARILNQPGNGTLAEITGATQRYRVWRGKEIRDAIRGQAPITDWDAGSTSRARVLNKPDTLGDLSESMTVTPNAADHFAVQDISDSNKWKLINASLVGTTGPAGPAGDLVSVSSVSGASISFTYNRTSRRLVIDDTALRTAINSKADA